jgi:nicotinamide riboside kinase
MEKRIQGRSDSELIRVVITGPECTGKSTLAVQLAEHFGGRYIPEYAREYIAGLGRSYTCDDVLHIAKRQVYEVNTATHGLVFYDTYLIITKEWLDVVFKQHPQWIDDEIRKKKIDLYLLCDTSIPWEPDPVRENGGEMREKLYLRYLDELENCSCHYEIITGVGNDRINRAIGAVSSWLNSVRHI